MSKHVVSSQDLMLLHKMLVHRTASRFFLENSEQMRYDIQYIQKSESAWILFVQSATTTEKLVIKILCHYRDERYDLSTIGQRQKCQSVAWEWNRAFSPSVYQGLAPVYQIDVKRKQLVPGKKVFSLNSMEQNIDYALVMRELPSERRLDVLIEECMESKDGNALRVCMAQLVQHVVHMHNDRLMPLSIAECDEENRRWGSGEQLHQKLTHNLALANSMIRSYPMFQKLKDTVENYHIHEQPMYRHYFQKRVDNGFIKRCHGDLKSPNIWIEEPGCEGNECVSVLDSIDFNPMYYNIDILSDFATLIVDIQTRTRGLEASEELVEDMIEMYLKGTGQQDDGALAVLRYYLFEKAYVGAAISFAYDEAYELGEAYLSVAEMRLEQLKKELEVPATHVMVGVGGL